MDFRLTDEQRQIQEMVREFALSEIKPHLMQWDEAQHFPTEVFKNAGGLGMLGVTVPEEYGGAGLSYVDYVNVIEELAVVDSGFALIQPHCDPPPPSGRRALRSRPTWRRRGERSRPSTSVRRSGVSSTRCFRPLSWQATPRRRAGSRTW